MTNKIPDISIVIVNWNVRDLLKKCLESIYKYSRDVSFETFVVDNNSSDGSPAMIRSDFPQVILTENRENFGFARANNQALAKCSGRYVLFLNPDTELIDNSIKAMVQFMDASPGASALGCKLIYPDGTLQHSCRHFPSIFTDLMESLCLDWLFPKNKFFNYYKIGLWQHDTVKSVDVPYGACLLVRKKALEDVGFMDERFFMYYDEIDLCYRIKKAGGKVYFTPDITVIHYANSSSSQAPLEMERYKSRSKFLFFKKHYGILAVAALFFNLAIRSLITRVLLPMRKIAIPLLVILPLLAAYMLILDNYPAITGDQTYYILLGKAIATGHGYKQIWDPHNANHIKFPFLYPIILSVCIFFKGYNFYIMRLLNLFFMGGALIAFYFLVKDKLDRFSVAAILLLTGLYSGAVYCVYHIYSEPAYLFFSMIAILFVRRYCIDKKLFSGPLAGAVIFLLAAYFTRTVGIALIIAALAFILIESRRGHNRMPALPESALMGCLIAVPIILYAWYNYLCGGMSSFYLTLISFNPAEMIAGIIYAAYSYIFYSFPHVITGISFEHRTLLGFICSAVVLLGLTGNLFKRRTLMEYYFVSYLSVILFYFATPYCKRFFVPMAPFIFYYFFQGVKGITGTMKIRMISGMIIRHIIVSALLIFSVWHFIIFVSDGKNYKDYNSNQLSDFLSAARWAKENTGRNSVFLGLNAPDIYLYCDRKALNIPVPSVSYAELVNYVITNKIDYILTSSVYLEEMTMQYERPVISMRPGKLRIAEAYRRNKDAIYKVTVR